MIDKNPIFSNWTEVFKAVADAIERTPAFRQHHTPVPGNRQEIAAAYTHAALTAAAEVISKKSETKEPITIVVNVPDSNITGQEIADRLIKYLKGHE